MDIHEIQRLHAQFAPDSMVIDLPRQLAALPAPGDLAVDDAPTARARWAQAGPLVRGSVIAVAVAVLVGMAGMGAASLYRTHRGDNTTVQPAPAIASTTTQPKSPPRIEQLSASSREIDATPARPVAAAPGLSERDFGTASSLGLTAEQFRASMRAPAVSDAPKAPAALSSEAQLAAASPIRRASTDRGEAQQSATAPVVSPQPGAPVDVQAVSKQVAPAAQPTTQPNTQARAAPAAAVPPTSAQTQASAPTSAVADTPKPARAVRHHVSRPRAEQAADADIAKPAPTNRAGSTEVQMF
ncbi:hypothetical protein [Caballeronia glathei]|uniref:Uncharacterized protein n=1 Tax=Caballeronia glathei TaxID=60547 RepID=A0A069PDT7_9BURK|nr:hypothetical protein [Caballeronia glathei]KDR37979.1 hypothetical protein BG61_04785 [Caballeronia glathei]